ncbi:MAG: nitrous oxide-stimulated promoter family protein [Clostridia bacterium]|nr:nitrous oxide-stimulated promoter family protein [Lachnospiraceae bacterium]NCC00113.1 nitrous oxide-stimulated promoter family protein [Clostridia bacterium]NCD01625.1 nitrous oxide-stimulated promoter family protein [Clostridia bacterium]
MKWVIENETKKIEEKRLKEQQVVAKMIELYCRKNHSNRDRDNLCSSCRELRDYAKARSEHCPFMEHKTFCNNCKVHCYKPEMREKIRQVMRFSGPRMLMYHPAMALWHLICIRREKKRIS